ncbi:hypothetical protein [Tabrizicola sp.]|uniref:hypothetical protein n=1 Tax=Tabrizicola sp. TaxID=2005166 RepID=UPI0027374692|nr:hypothetical protein [Tabrizicola sp.]MDP3194769.1 hypothetical protein [Tabrizicola sp.]
MIRGPISLLIVGAVMLGATLLVTLGPRAFEGILPAAVLDAMDGTTIGEFTSRRTGSGETPADFLSDGPDGLEVTGPIAAAAGNRPVFIRDVIDNYTTRVGSGAPAELMTIRPISGCRLTPPLEGTTVGHVTAGRTGLDLPILAYNDSDLAAAVQVFVNRYRKAGAVDVRPSAELAYEVYDVAVTETRAPVYLVLESFVRNRIWNIHLAPGARIERVVLLGGTHAGVANLDPVVPVEVLPAAALTACGIQPAYALNPGHRFFEVLSDGPASYKAEAEVKFVAMQDSIAAYNTWFRDSFGVMADVSRAGFGGTISVVGPQPGAAEPKAVYASIQGARIRMTQDTYVEIEGQVAEGEDFAARVRAIATSFAFGDLANLRQGVQF